MATLKTTEHNDSVNKFLDTVEDDTKRKDSYALVEMMQQITGYPPKMWGPSIIGFGSYHYKYESGHEGDAPLLAFSPRKQNLTLYLNYGHDNSQELLQKLGKHKTGKGCLYIKQLNGIDIAVLKSLMKHSFERMKEIYK